MPASFRKRAFRAQTKSVNPGAALINRNQRQSSLPAAICQALRDCQMRWQGDELRQAAEIQAVKTPQESARGRKPFRILSSPAAYASGTGRFLRRERLFSRAKVGSMQFPRPKIPRISEETGEGGQRRGFCGFAKGKTAASQIGNLRRGAWRGRYSPVRPLVKNTFLTSGNFAKRRSFRALTNPANAKIALIKRWPVPQATDKGKKWPPVVE